MTNINNTKDCLTWLNTEIVKPSVNLSKKLEKHMQNSAPKKLRANRSKKAMLIKEIRKDFRLLFFLGL